ncbi:hypothetical protein B4N84_26840 [Flavobacterium sp. IR1]|nr:hypothetical protein B4N84_26840 [Flavobacterium sp. IR1]
MNTRVEKTLENESKAAASNVPNQQKNGASSFELVNNRPEAIAQRRLQETINNSPRVKQLRSLQDIANNFNSQTVQQKKYVQETLQGKFEPVEKEENKTGLPDNLKNGIENLSGYSMSDVNVHYNSDKPAQLHAHAYAQGTDIHLSTGQEKYLPHEAWHVVQQKQGRVKPTVQMKGEVSVNDDTGLENEADVMGIKSQSAGELITKDKVQLKKKLNDTPPAQQTVMQKVSSVIVGESHGKPKINVERKATFFSTNPGKGWIMSSEPSKLAAALIQHNNFVPPGNFKTELERQMGINGGLKNVMNTAESISNGNEKCWGAENNLIGSGSTAKVGSNIAPKDKRTHIENPQVRKNATFLRTLSALGNHSIPKASVNLGYPDKSGYQILASMGVASAEALVGSVSPVIQSKWANLKKLDGLFGIVHVPPDNKDIWISETTSNIEKGLQELLDVSITEICNLLGDEFNDPLKSNNQGEQLIKDIANLKYGNDASALSRMHAAASIARTLTQLKGMSDNNEDYQKANPALNNLKTGYIVGDSHLTDFEKIKSDHTKKDELKSLIDNTTIVRTSEYNDLKKSAQDAVISTNRSDTLTIT